MGLEAGGAAIGSAPVADCMMKGTTMLPQPEIIDRGRGPEIKGTRITVYDVMDYYKQGHHRDHIASILRLGSAEVEVAIRYIEEHKDEVMADYREILDRCARGNPPEIEAKLEAAHRRARTRIAAIRAAAKGGDIDRASP